MKRYIFLFAMILVSVAVFAQSAENRAIKAYDNKNYEEAINIYDSIVQSGNVSSRLFYNLGNAYYRAGDNGKAVWNYERALKLNPRNTEARENLEFVKTKLTERILPEENIIVVFFQELQDLMSPNGWAVTGMVAFALFIIGFATYSFCSGLGMRKLGFFGGIVMLLLCIFANVMSSKAGKRMTEMRYAIVLNDSTTLSTVSHHPTSTAEEAFSLHAGAKLEKLDSAKLDTETWYKVRTEDRREAWVDGSTIGHI